MIKEFTLPKNGSDTTKIFTWKKDGLPHKWPKGVYRCIGAAENANAIAWQDSDFLMVVNTGDEGGTNALYFHHGFPLPGVCPKSGIWNESLFIPLPIGTKMTIVLTV